MLHRVEIRNFYSVRDPLVLDFSISKSVPTTERQFVSPFGDDKRIPKVIAFMGGNAVGKTNILKSLTFVDWFVEKSLDAPADRALPVFGFMDREHADEPQYVSIEFSDQFIFDRNLMFKYELMVGGSLSPGKVIFERLWYKPGNRYQKILDRDEFGVKPSKIFEIPANDPRRTALSANASVLAALAKFGHRLSDIVKMVIGQKLSSNIDFVGRLEFDPDKTTQFYNEYKHHFDAFQEFACRIDTGIMKVDLFENNGRREPRFYHRGLDMHLPLFLESEGTQHIYKMFPTINMALAYGGAAIIDELDSNIHTFVVNEIIRMFRNPETNPKNAQLLFTCHNPSILENLSKEEVFLVEKNSSGATTCFGLKNMEGLRRDVNLYQKYMGGVLGGTPVVG